METAESFRRSSFAAAFALAGFALAGFEAPALGVAAAPLAAVPRPVPTLRTADDPKLDDASRTAILEGVLRRIGEEYVLADLAEAMTKDVRERIAEGDYENYSKTSTLCDALTRHLRGVSKDKHLAVVFHAEPRPAGPDAVAPPSPEALEERRRASARGNFGFVKVEILPGNVGYLDVRGFAPVEFARGAAAAAMGFLAGTDALIVDLRTNGGGEPAMVAHLASYFFDEEPVHLNDLWERAGDRTEEWWTERSLPGPRYGAARPVFVLTSRQTFSGGEEFAYDLQTQRRAPIVGDPTGGGAHPTKGVRLSDHVDLHLPFARAVNPITKTNWEGVGVKPDVAVAAEKALSTAHALAARRLLESNPAPEIAEGLRVALAGLEPPAGGNP
jgi:hypothetical protein